MKKTTANCDECHTDRRVTFYEMSNTRLCDPCAVNLKVITYQQQAEKFLTDNGLRFRATPTEANNCPLWEDGRHTHGDEYQITISRIGQSGRLSFRFWNSLNDMQKGEDPNAYDVLACVSSDASTPETFEDFCSEYGYDQDSHKAEKTFKAADRLARRIRAFFSETEIEALQEIR